VQVQSRVAAVPHPVDKQVRIDSIVEEVVDVPSSRLILDRCPLPLQCARRPVRVIPNRSRRRHKVMAIETPRESSISFRSVHRSLLEC
jgi:hypothetical protein